MRILVNAESVLLSSISLLVLSGISQPARAESADTLFAKGLFNEASSKYLHEIKSDPHNASLRMDEIRTLLRIDGDSWQEAITQGQAAVKIAPDNADAHGLYSMALMRGGMPEEAVTQANKALSLNPKAYFALVAAGRAAEWNENKKQAKADYLKAITLFPHRATAYPYFLGTLDSDKDKKYIPLFKQYVKLHAKGFPHSDLMRDFSDSHFLKQKEKNKADDQKVTSSFAPAKATAAEVSAAPNPAEEDVVYSIPFTRDDGGIVLPVKIHGVLYHMLLDTGAGDGVTLTHQAVHTLGLDPVGQSVQSGVSGYEIGKIYEAGDMQVGTEYFHNVEVESMSDASGHTDGLIGGYVFKKSVLTFDFANNNLIISTGKDAKAPEPSQDDAVMTVPFHLYHGYIFVPVVLGDRTKSEYALLDTGCEPLGVLSIHTAKDLAKLQNSDSYENVTINQRLGVGTSDPSFNALIFRFSVDLTMAHATGLPLMEELNPIFGANFIDRSVDPSFDFQLCGIVGIPYLENAKIVTIDYPHKLLTMEYANN